MNKIIAHNKFYKQSIETQTVPWKKSYNHIGASYFSVNFMAKNEHCLYFVVEILDELYYFCIIIFAKTTSI